MNKGLCVLRGMRGGLERGDGKVVVGGFVVGGAVGDWFAVASCGSIGSNRGGGCRVCGMVSGMYCVGWKWDWCLEVEEMEC